MTCLPIVERELRVASRRPGTYWLRFASGLGAILLFFIMLVANWREDPHELSQEIFGFSMALTGLACLFSGVFQTADSLSGEKRQGTMGLLFMTDLLGYDVVLGKFASGSLRVFYCLLSALPILALPLMMGGVSGAQVARCMVLLLTASFFSLSVGIFVSALCRDSRQSIGITLFLILFATGILPAINGVLNLYWGRPAIVHWLLWPSLGYAFARSFDFFYGMGGGGRMEFWGSLASVMVIGLVLLILACLILPRAWQERGSASTGRLKQFRMWLRYGGPKRRRRARLRVLPRNPFEWLARRDRSAQLRFWMLGFPILAIWLSVVIGINLTGRRLYGGAFFLMIWVNFALTLLFKCIVTLEACRCLNDDRRSGALELLLVTPIDDRSIVAGQRNSLSRQFGLPMLLPIATLATQAWLCVQWNFARPENVTLLAGSAVALPVDFFAISWVGIWEGLRAKNHSLAALVTLAKILFLPWLLFILMGVCGILDRGGWKALAFWFAAGFFIDVFWVLRARKRLRLLFRATAAGTAAKRRRRIPGLSRQMAV